DDDSLIVLRSTVYPGTTEKLARDLKARGRRIHMAFCPERSVQGRSIDEIATLPQIVSGMTPEAELRAAGLFQGIAPSVVRLRPIEAEFAKLFANAYRYIQFAAANQLFMIAEKAGVDFYKVAAAMKKDYPRLQHLPMPGFAA